MSAEATGWVWRYSPYKGAELLIHLAIADVVNDAHGNEFWMGMEGLAEKARTSRSTAFATVREMVSDGYLALVEPGKAGRKTARYRFTSPTTGLASPVWGLSLARSPDHNSIEPKVNETKSSSPVSGLADCARCQGRGTYWNAAGGFDAECSCTRRALKVVEDAG
jgi:hypothetical protein